VEKMPLVANTTNHQTSSCITANRRASPRSMHYTSWRIQTHRKYVTITKKDLRQLGGFGENFQTFDEGLERNVDPNLQQVW